MISRGQLNKVKKSAQERKTKATDMDLLISKILELPQGQLKKILTDDILAILKKYGY